MTTTEHLLGEPKAPAWPQGLWLPTANKALGRWRAGHCGEMFSSLRAPPWRLQGNRRLDLKQWCFPTAWPNDSPQDYCHSLSLKCRYKALCLSQLHCSVTSCACILDTELLVNNNLSSNSWRKSSTKYFIPQLRKISPHPNKKLLLDLGRGTKPIFEVVFNLKICVTIVLVDTCLLELCHPQTISSWREVHNQNVKQNTFICYQ